MSEFHGVLPALITPFSDDGSAIDTGLAAAERDDTRIREVTHV